MKILNQSRVVWLNPNTLTPPHRLTREDAMLDLAVQFYRSGWDRTKPALVAYEHVNRIQLLSGTHRCIAARLAGIEVPVSVQSYAMVALAHGNVDVWRNVMESGNIEY